MILLDSYNQFNHKKWFHASPECRSAQVRHLHRDKGNLNCRLMMFPVELHDYLLFLSCLHTTLLANF